MKNSNEFGVVVEDGGADGRRGTPGRPVKQADGAEPGRSYVVALQRWPDEVASIGRGELAALLHCSDATLSEKLNTKRDWKATDNLLDWALKIIRGCGGTEEDAANWTFYHEIVKKYPQTGSAGDPPRPPGPGDKDYRKPHYKRRGGLAAVTSRLRESKKRHAIWSVILVAVAAAFAGTLAWFWPDGNSPSGAGSFSSEANQQRLTINAGDDLDVSKPQIGVSLSQKDINLHSREALVDQFVLTPQGTARLARTSEAPTKDSCTKALDQRTDKFHVVTPKGAAEGGTMAVHDWLCVRTNSDVLAGVRVEELKDGLPGSLDVLIVTWSN